MATLKEIVYNIKNIAEGGFSQDTDSKISTLQVEFLVHTYRAQLLLQYSNNGRKLHPETLQSHVVTISGTDVNKVTLPSLVQFNSQRAIKSIKAKIGATENIEVFLSSEGMTTYSTSNKFTGSSKKAYLKNGELHFNFDTDTSDTITILGCFSNPKDVSTYVDDDTTEYPLPQELVTVLTQQILQNEYRVVINEPRDKEVDGQTPREKVQGQVRQR